MASGLNCGRKQCPGAKRIANHFHYLRNKAVYVSKALTWASKPENLAKRSAYFEATRAQARARTRAWVCKNPDRKRAMDASFKAQNRTLVTSYKAAYRARKMRATPPWLTAEHWEDIRKIYASCPPGHDVDHIVPLQGRSVCGLHVPWNLRVLTRDENNRRPRIFA
jgi:hypothetical protein